MHIYFMRIRLTTLNICNSIITLLYSPKVII